MRLAERHGPVLSGRTAAMALRKELEQELAEGGVAVLDFAGVEAISPSFADEVFGRFVARAGKDQVRFENLSGHLVNVERMVRRRSRAVSGRPALP